MRNDRENAHVPPAACGCGRRARFHRRATLGPTQHQAAPVRRRPVLAQAAARQLDPRPGRRHRRRQATTTSGSSIGPRRWSTTRRARRRTRPRRAAARRRRRCCSSTPDGKLLRSWGGPGAGYDWPKNEHGIHVDAAGNVWVAGNGNDDHQILKFTPDGKFLQQIGKAGSTGGSNSTTQLGRPAHMVTDDAAGELYVADGYGNRRVVVFDIEDRRLQAPLGRLRHQDADRRQAAGLQAGRDHRAVEAFANPVHCVRLSRDGLVYVCDRANDRIQVFKKDGTFVKEFRVDAETLQNGSVWDLVLSEDAAAALHLRRRRRQQADRHARPRDRQAARQLRPPRPHGRRVQVGAQHGHRLQGQPLHRRGRHAAGARRSSSGRVQVTEGSKQ